VAASVDCVMLSHIWYRAIDTTTIPATLSLSIRQLLLQQLGFNGVIMTDCLEMDAIQNHMSTSEAAVRTLAASVDLVTISHR
jgi:beta-N-acetylhexosaminidase